MTSLNITSIDTANTVTNNELNTKTSNSTDTDVKNSNEKNTNSDIVKLSDLTSIKLDEYPLDKIYLPNKWTLYLYDKQLFKKLVNKDNFKEKPHKEICTIQTVADLLYILRIMKAKAEPKVKIASVNTDIINLDTNDYIIMRKGIEPIWEDPKNSNGGTYTIKMAHSKGYDVWNTFVMYMLGETMTYEMHNINGITVSYISDGNSQRPFGNGTIPNSRYIGSNNSYTYIKIWDGKQNRSVNDFEKILPTDLFDKIKAESRMYSLNNTKKDFNEKNIINKLSSQRGYSKENSGGFKNTKVGYSRNTRY